MTKKIKSARL